MSKYDLDNLFNSPTYRMINKMQNSFQMEGLRHIQNSPNFEILRQITENPAIEQINRISQSMPELAILRQFHANPVFQNAFELAEKLRMFESPILARSKFVENLQFNNDLNLELLIEEYETQIEQGPKNNLSFEFYLSMLISLAMFIYSEYSSFSSEQQLVENIQTLENQVQVLADKIEQSSNSSFFVVESSVNLRVSPNMDSTILEVLAPKLKLNGLKTQGKWLKVEYFDYLSNVMVEGWVHSDYLQIVIVNNGE
ncbi:hypothetical protein GNP68_19405 [Aliivibrio fischeri]|nr:hypothetical protein [Aliivibrio fischeri]